MALTQHTKLIARDGRHVTLQDLKPGMQIEVTGYPGDEGTLLAEEVRILP